MPFQTVPPIDSAQYINTPKSDFETEYYVDNLNTLGEGGGGGISVAWAGNSADTSATETITSWNAFATSSDVNVDGPFFGFVTSGVYQVSFNVGLFDSGGFGGSLLVRFQTGSGESTVPFVYLREPFAPSETMIVSGTGVFLIDGPTNAVLDVGSATKSLPGLFTHSLSILKLA